MVRVTDRGAVVVSVAVPVQHFRAVRGALMLTTQGDDIDQLVLSERLAILKVGGVASAVPVSGSDMGDPVSPRGRTAARTVGRFLPPAHSA